MLFEATIHKWQTYGASIIGVGRPSHHRIFASCRMDIAAGSGAAHFLAGDQCLPNEKSVETFPCMDARKRAKKFQVELGTPPRGDRSM